MVESEAFSLSGQMKINNNYHMLKRLLLEITLYFLIFRSTSPCKSKYIVLSMSIECGSAHVAESVSSNAMVWKLTSWHRVSRLLIREKWVLDFLEI